MNQGIHPGLTLYAIRKRTFRMFYTDRWIQSWSMMNQSLHPFSTRN